MSKRRKNNKKTVKSEKCIQKSEKDPDITLEPDKSKSNNVRNYILNVFPIFISIVALILSFITHVTNENRVNYQESESFNVVQNLWNDSPEYILYNESTKKLSDIPSPTYIMFVPTKVRGLVKNDMTHMFLQPVSYTYVEEQIKSGKTTEDIVKSKLPYYFKGKYGIRDVETSVVENPLYENGSSFPEKVEVTTYPYLMIAVQIDYKYIGDSENKTQYFVTNPGGKYDIDKNRYNNIIKYMSENSYMEIKMEDIQNSRDPDKKESIYKSAHRKAVNILNSSRTKDGKKQLLKLIGGIEGGYGGILKDLNDMATGVDIIGEYGRREY